MFGLDGNNNDIRYQLNEEISEDGEVEQASEVRPTTEGQSTETTSDFNDKNEFPTDEMNHCIKS